MVVNFQFLISYLLLKFISCLILFLYYQKIYYDFKFHLHFMNLSITFMTLIQAIIYSIVINVQLLYQKQYRYHLPLIYKCLCFLNRNKGIYLHINYIFVTHFQTCCLPVIILTIIRHQIPPYFSTIITPYQNQTSSRHLILVIFSHQLFPLDQVCPYHLFWG